MKTLLLALSLSALVISPFANRSHAMPVAEEGFEGELEVDLKNAEYVKLQINGVDSDNVEFAKNGKMAIIKGFDLNAERTNVTLIPTSSTLASVDIDVTAKDFKRVRKGKILRFVAKRTVTFPKSDGVAPNPKPTPKPEPDSPPFPADRDDL